MALLSKLLSLAVPPRCLSCRKPTVANATICDVCTLAVPWLPTGCCPACALPDCASDAPCPALNQGFDSALAVCSYDGVAESLVKALKFQRALRAADVMAEHFSQWCSNCDSLSDRVLVPVPAQPSRYAQRGFNVAAVFANALSKRLAIQSVDILVRRDFGVSQKLKTEVERRNGEQQQARVLARCESPERVILVDDVYTTGMTLDVCTRALKTAGASYVCALTYARTLRFAPS